jgi:hypothetical protein
MDFDPRVRLESLTSQADWTGANGSIYSGPTIQLTIRVGKARAENLRAALLEFFN